MFFKNLHKLKFTKSLFNKKNKLSETESREEDVDIVENNNIDDIDIENLASEIKEEVKHKTEHISKDETKDVFVFDLSKFSKEKKENGEADEEEVSTEETEVDLYPEEESETIETEKEEPTIKTKKERKKKDFSIKEGLKNKIMYAVIVLLVALILAGISLISFLREKIITADVDKGIIITQPLEGLNNANYTFINQRSIFDNEIIGIKKILFDTYKTKIYFENKIDLKKIHLEIYDDTGKKYYLDELNVDFSKEDSFLTSEIDFDPIDIGARTIVLNMLNVENKNKTEFKFSFEKPLAKTHIKYFTNRPRTILDDEGVLLQIEESLFSSYGSIVNYSIQSQKPSITIKTENLTNKSSISISEGASTLEPGNESVETFYFEDENLILGRTSFSPLRNLNSNLRINFISLFKEYRMDREVDPGELFLNKVDYQEKIPIGGQNLILERMGARDKEYILVLHAEDENLNRVEVRPDISLLIPEESGNYTSIKGKNFSGDEGTDVVFNKSDNINASRESLKLKINAVGFRIDNVSVEADIDKSLEYPDESIVNAEKFIIDSFNNRLLYKSNKIKKNEISGFSDETLKNPEFIKDYEPKAGELSEEAYYNNRILISTAIDDKIYAIVDEIWKPFLESKDYSFKRRHKIVVSIEEQGYRIEKDEIVEVK